MAQEALSSMGFLDQKWRHIQNMLAEMSDRRRESLILHEAYVLVNLVQPISHPREEGRLPYSVFKPTGEADGHFCTGCLGW